MKDFAVIQLDHINTKREPTASVHNSKVSNGFVKQDFLGKSHVSSHTVFQKALHHFFLN